MPGVLAETQASAKGTLESYVRSYIEEEIRSEALGRQMGPFTVFLRLAGAVCRCPEPQQLTERVRAIGWDRL
jgi:hypothetical protein